MSGVRVRRGRTAAYRRIWQWPLRTVPRAIGTIVAALLVVAGLSALSGSPSDVTTSPQPAAGSRTTSATVPPPAPATSSATSPTRTIAPSAVPPSNGAAPGSAPPAGGSPAPPAGQDVAGTARAWTQAWLKAHTVTREQWLAGLKPFTTEEYLGLLTTTDPANVPTATTIPGPVTVTSNNSTSATVGVAVGTTAVRLALIRTPAGWRVSNADSG